MSFRAAVATCGTAALLFSVMSGNYYWAALVVIIYVATMPLRDWLARRAKYRGWIDITPGRQDR
jgi:hypothetical protein